MAVSPTVLTLRAAGLGDLLTAVPALRAVRRAHPGAQHVLATNDTLSALVPLLDAVDATVPAVVSNDTRPPLVPVEVAVNLHGCGPESHRTLLACRPGSLHAYARADLGIEGPTWDPEEHEVARWCRLVSERGMPADPEDLEISVPVGSVPPGVRGATVLHPGAAAGSRRWPISRWAAVAAAEISNGHEVAVTLGPGEASWGRALAEAVPRVRVVDCADDLGLLVRVLAGARVVVCGDTGVGHLATAVRTPSVVLFGPEPPSRWGPPPSRPWHVALWAGRRGDPHASRPDPGLLEIGVLDVLLELPRVRRAATIPYLPGTEIESIDVRP